MSTVKVHYKWPTRDHNAFGTCVFCSPKLVQFQLSFDQGSVAPIAGEVLTGGDSTDTGVVATYKSGVGTAVTRTDLHIESGSWAGSDAKGYVMLNSCTGVTETTTDGRSCFQDNEAITGDTAAALVVDDVAIEKVSMIPWPTQMLSKYEGKWYCPYHYPFRVNRKELDKTRLPSDVFDD